MKLAHKSAPRAVARGLPDIESAFEEHGAFVHALARQLVDAGGDPDDLAQEVFFLAWRKLPEFRGGSMRTWLCQMTVKLAAGARRRAWVRRHLGLDSASEPVDLATPERSLEVREANAIFTEAIAAMSLKKRTVFVLAEIHDFSGPEIAQALDCELATVYSRLHHARREFEQFIERMPQPGAKVVDR